MVRAATRRQALAVLGACLAWSALARFSAAAPVPTTLPKNISALDWDTLIRTVWGEARGEKSPGLRAVCSVILNRARSPYFPDTIHEVCRQRHQFSVWTPGDPNRAKMLQVTTADLSFQLAIQACADMVLGRVPDMTRSADHYHSVHDGTPRWARGRTPVVVIGKHRFFKLY